MSSKSKLWIFRLRHIIEAAEESLEWEVLQHELPPLLPLLRIMLEHESTGEE